MARPSRKTSKNFQQAKLLADRIRALRMQLDLSQEELAQSAGLSVFTISKLERGQRVDPSVFVDALRIAYAEVEALVANVPGAQNVAVPIPGTSEAVRIVMAEEHRVWSVAELTEELNKRGWMSKGAKPAAALRATIHRLGKIGTIEVVDRGRYRIATDGSEQIVEGGEET